MPIARFGSTLISKKQFKNYINLLKNSFSNNALQKVMCKSLLSIDYCGFVYDCDFNQMLNMSLSNSLKKHITEININDLHGLKINKGDHCYGCTAGAGSSCEGSLKE